MDDQVKYPMVPGWNQDSITLAQIQKLCTALEPLLPVTQRLYRIINSIERAACSDALLSSIPRPLDEIDRKTKVSIYKHCARWMRVLIYHGAAEWQGPKKPLKWLWKKGELGAIGYDALPHIPPKTLAVLFVGVDGEPLSWNSLRNNVLIFSERVDAVIDQIRKDYETEADTRGGALTFGWVFQAINLERLFEKGIFPAWIRVLQYHGFLDGTGRRWLSTLKTLSGLKEFLPLHWEDFAKLFLDKDGNTIDAESLRKSIRIEWEREYPGVLSHLLKTIY